jgi:sulfur carrier protein
MSLTLVVNGEERAFGNLAPVTLADVIAEMNLKGDRVAVEHNGTIIQRASWSDTFVGSGDRLEVVHFVGGGTDGAMKPGETLQSILRRTKTKAEAGSGSDYT